MNYFIPTCLLINLFLSLTSYAFDESQLLKFKVIKICKGCDLSSAVLEKLDLNKFEKLIIQRQNQNHISLTPSKQSNKYFEQSNKIKSKSRFRLKTIKTVSEDGRTI